MSRASDFTVHLPSHERRNDVALHAEEPLVSILTPVYNGEEFLAECIESVLAQDYQNWEYHIVNNCSTDGTLRIAESYARKEPRIRITVNTTFVNVAENHNNAFRLISPDSVYTKVLSADDWMVPHCLTTMVRFALAHPSVGIVAGYQQSGSKIRWQELPRSIEVLPGRDACRLALLKGVQIFGAPTAFLYRSDLLRKDKPFFPNSRPHADTSACYESLQYCDYGVVHEVLSAERLHSGQVSSPIEELGAGSVAYLDGLLEYGPTFLSAEEFASRKAEAFGIYYQYLGGSLLKLKGAAFWDFQASRLRDIGCQLDWSRVVGCAVREALIEIKNPARAARKAFKAVSHGAGWGR
jgi:glycosyltransferase involved in cell wall biosynthesis